ncbi:MAG: tRNA (adenosine(37)-N6)-threonylcarbamoyltransferase complex dimerization subunit type 1 TsaB [Sterolibacteriaceae bacterium MAG5]|nr:tRNA (adenosine(37)-N6)-threonylcarbamoyltransferase complex dimerization subunit type 1 TsaB [Candidatus Nitricoxidireducens bremensis]
MKLLALETSTRWLSVALWQDGEMLVRRADSHNGGSALVLPWVAELLAEAGLRHADIDAVAFGAGPGSFTGLRLACGVAQGLAFGLDRPAMGVTTLEALAVASGEDRVFACLDARMGEVYFAAYEVDGDEVTAVLAPRVAPPADVRTPAGEWIGCGDGFAAYGEQLPRLAQLRPDVWPTAEAVAAIAAPRFARGEGSVAAQAMPLYVRDKVALTTAERLARGGVR